MHTTAHTTMLTTTTMTWMDVIAVNEVQTQSRGSPRCARVFVGCLKIFNPATLNLATRKFGEKYVWELRGGRPGRPCLQRKSSSLFLSRFV